MTRVKKRRNGGLARTLNCAGQSALQQIFGSGHFGTRASHKERWALFVAWLRVTYGVRDGREIRQWMIQKYTDHLRSRVQAGNLSVATAINRLSTVNRILPRLVGHRLWCVSPSKALGMRRTHVRARPAKSDDVAMAWAVESLRDRDHAHAAAVVLLVARFGLRVREACLLQVHVALLQAELHQRIWITEGSKGGSAKHMDRSVPVDAAGLAALQEAAAVAGPNANLIPDRWPDKQLKKFRSHLYGVVSPRLKAVGIKDLRDLRAAYACRRYEQLTGNPAPVNVTLDLDAVDSVTTEVRDQIGMHPGGLMSDADARAVISYELGHRRKQVAASYVGKAK